MAKYFVFLHPVDKKVHAKLTNSAPAGATKIGEFVHNGEDTLSHSGNHTIIHHIQEILYKVNKAGQPAFFPEGITDLSAYAMIIEPVVMGIKVTLSPATVELAVGATQALAATVLPTNAYDKTLVHSSSDPEVATVSEAGLVTAVAVGTAEITAQLKDTNVVGKVAVTVTAE